MTSSARTSDQLDLGGLLDWQARWLLAFEDAAHVHTCAFGVRKAPNSAHDGGGW